MKYDKKKTINLLEEGVSNIFTALFRMKESGDYEDAYIGMTSIRNMLNEDIQHLLTTQKIDILERKDNG